MGIGEPAAPASSRPPPLAAWRRGRSARKVEIGLGQVRRLEIQKHDREGVGRGADHGVGAALLDIKVGKREAPLDDEDVLPVLEVVNGVGVGFVVDTEPVGTRAAPQIVVALAPRQRVVTTMAVDAVIAGPPPLRVSSPCTPG